MLRAAETAFREGTASVVEILDAHRAARDVRLRGLELRRDVMFARLDLEIALGHLLREP
jgi:outer membrane protein TolC